MRGTFITRCGAAAIGTVLIAACNQSPVGPSAAVSLIADRSAADPTTGSPTAAPSNPPPSPTIQFVIEGTRSAITVTWNSVSGTASYVVELGRLAGTGDLGSFDVNQTMFTTSDLPVGRVFARVRTRNGEVTGAWSADVSEYVFDFKDYVETLFLGTGPLAPRDGNHGCSATGWVRGFAPGTEVPVFVSATVSSDKATAIRVVVDQVSQATMGVVRARYTETSDANPLPGRDQVTATTHPSPSTQGCASNGGCTIHVFTDNARPGRFISSRAVQPAQQTPGAYAHDVVGHGVLGLCHVDGELIGGARHSMMSAGPGVFSGDIAESLTAYDLAAVHALYSSGIRPGAQRSDLLQAGLIHP